MSKADGDLISTAEACAALGVDRSTLLRWADKGTATPAVEMPGLTGAKLWRRSDIQRLARAREREEAAS